MGPNGTMTVTQGNVSATLTAPPGTNVSSFKIMPEEHRNSVDLLGDSSWTIHNSTSGSTGTINFHVRIIECGIKVSKDFCYAKVIETYTRTLNGNIHKGIFENWVVEQGEPWEMCAGIHPFGSYAPSDCTYLTAEKVSLNQIEFKDSHGGIIDLTRNAMTNEGSYKNGLEQGKEEYSVCVLEPGMGCTREADVCSNLSLSNIACVDGYIQGWNHTCDPIKAKRAELDCPTTLRNEIHNDTSMFG